MQASFSTSLANDATALRDGWLRPPRPSTRSLSAPRESAEYLRQNTAPRDSTISARNSWTQFLPYGPRDSSALLPRDSRPSWAVRLMHVPGPALLTPPISSEFNEVEPTPPPAPPSCWEAAGCGTNRPPCGRRWPFLCVAILLSGAPSLISELLIVNIAATSFSDGTVDPCTVCADGDAPCWQTAVCKRALRDVVDAQAVSNTLSCILMLCCSPLADIWCDKIGRKPVLLASGLLVLAQAATLEGVIRGLSAYWWYGAITLLSLLPGNVGWRTLISDLVEPAQRGHVFSLVLAGEDFNGIVLPLVVSTLPVEACVIMSMAFAAIMLVIVLFVVRETRTKEKRLEPQTHPETQPSDAGGTCTSLGGMRLIFANRLLTGIALLAFVSGLTVSGSQAILLPFYKSQFGLDQRTASPLVSVYYAANLFVNVIAGDPLLRCMGPKLLLVFAYTVRMGFSVSMFFIDDSLGLLFVLLGVSFASLAMPIFFRVLSNALPEEGGERVSASVLLIQNIGRIIGLPLYNLAFGYLLENESGLGDRAPGAVFLFGACLHLLCLLVAICLPASAFQNSGVAAELDSPPRPASEEVVGFPRS